jgi:hypothetical protein
LKTVEPVEKHPFDPAAPDDGDHFGGERVGDGVEGRTPDQLDEPTLDVTRAVSFGRRP